MSTAAPAPESIFEPAGHRYILGGIQRPGVTTILKNAGLIDTTWFTERARWLGSAVHRACQLDDLGTLNESKLDPALWGRLKAWRKFKLETGFVPQLIESPMICETFGGMPDRIGPFRGGRMVVDLKSGLVYRWVALQTSGYSWLDNLVNGTKIIHRRIGVRLQDDGRYSVREFLPKHYHRDLRIFQGLVALHHWNNLTE